MFALMNEMDNASDCHLEGRPDIVHEYRNQATSTEILIAHEDLMALYMKQMDRQIARDDALEKMEVPQWVCPKKS